MLGELHGSWGWNLGQLSSISFQATGCVSGWFLVSLCLSVLVGRAHRAWGEKGRDAQTTGEPHRLPLRSPSKAIQFHPEQETVQTLGHVMPLPTKHSRQVGWRKCYGDYHVSVGIACGSTIPHTFTVPCPRGHQQPYKRLHPTTNPASRMGCWIWQVSSGYSGSDHHFQSVHPTWPGNLGSSSYGQQKQSVLNPLTDGKGHALTNF